MNNTLNKPFQPSDVGHEARMRAQMYLASMRSDQQSQMTLVLDTLQVPRDLYSPALAKAAEITGARGLAGGVENRVRLIDVKNCCDRTVAALTELGFQLTDE